MGLAGRVAAAIESLKIWEETHLADVHAELARLARQQDAAVPVPEPAQEEPGAPAEDGGKHAKPSGGD